MRDKSLKLLKQNFQDFRIIMSFSSKKNKVYLVEVIKQNRQENYILKDFNGESNKEYKILSLLKKKGVAVPEICYPSKDSLIMEYITGPTLLEVFCELEREQAGMADVEKVFCPLNSWFLEFYRSIGSIEGQTIRGDINFRNFIFHDSRVYGIDFEDCRKGKKEEDIGRLCAFGLTYDPIFTDWKIRVVRYLFNFSAGILNLDKELTVQEMIRELKSIEERRKIKVAEGLIARVIEDL